jgi:hypothetical protein
MDNFIFRFIIILVVLAIYWMNIIYPNTKQNQTITKENFYSTNYYMNEPESKCTQLDILSLNPYHRCKVLGINKFMIRDLRTKLWLTDSLQYGFSKFLPGKFGVPLVMSDKPDEYLPLRTVVDPNDYLLATYSGDEIRVVSNPYNQTFVLQVFIYNGYNIIGYINEANTQLYLYMDDNGNISSTPKPFEASVIEIIEI